MRSTLRSIGTTLSIPILVFALAFGVSWATTPGNVVDNVDNVRYSLARLFTNDADFSTTCTAFSINEEKSFWMTAYHCIGQNMLLDGQIAWSVYRSAKHDLAVLESPGITKPALVPCAREPIMAETVGGLGFAHGWDVAQYREGKVALSRVTGLNVPETDADEEFLITDFEWIGGMSGGPIIMEDGCVLSVIQASGDESGTGRTLTTILAATRQFWEYN